MIEAAAHQRSHSCINCGYDLRGLKRSSSCPECGCDIWRSFDARLIHSDPRWLNRVAWGLRLIGWAIQMAMISVIGLGAGLLVEWMTGGAGPANWLLWVVFGMNVFVVLNAAGAILLTWPWSGEANVEHTDVQRVVARWGFAACAFAMFTIETRQSAWVLSLATEFFIVLLLFPLWLWSAAAVVAQMSALARRVARHGVGERLSELFQGYSLWIRRFAYTVLGIEVVCFIANATVTTMDFLGPLIALAMIIAAIPIIVLAVGGYAATRELGEEIQHSRDIALQRFTQAAAGSPPPP